MAFVDKGLKTRCVKKLLMFFKVHNYLFIVYTGILYCITMFGFADRVMYVYAIFCDAITFSLRKVYIKNFW